MRFWLITIAQYLLAALATLLLSIVISLLTTQLLLPPDENIFVGGIIWFFVFLAEGTLLVPLGLAITAEFVERKAHARRFAWSRALRRFPIAIPIGIGPLFTARFAIMMTEDDRPAHWVEIQVFLYCVSAMFAYLALRIRKQTMRRLP